MHQEQIENQTQKIIVTFQNTLDGMAQQDRYNSIKSLDSTQ